jgi:hypothetical protein
MKSLLDNEFAPVTFTYGFVERPFAEFSQAFVKWQKEIGAKFKTRTEEYHFQAELPSTDTY